MEHTIPGMLDMDAAAGSAAGGGVIKENLTALAVGMAVCQVTKIMAVWCPHRKRVALQMLHDNDDRGQQLQQQQLQQQQPQQQHIQQQQLQDRDDNQTTDSTEQQPNERADEAWSKLFANAPYSNTISTSKKQTPENAIRIYSKDRATKQLLLQFDGQCDDYKLQ